MKKDVNKILGDVIGSIVSLADDERKKSDSYKTLFKETKDKPLPVFASELVELMTSHVLDATVILEENGYKISEDVYHFLLALPLAAKLLKDKIVKEEGTTCSVDKVNYLLGQEFRNLLKE